METDTAGCGQKEDEFTAKKRCCPWQSEQRMEGNHRSELAVSRRQVIFCAGVPKEISAVRL